MKNKKIYKIIIVLIILFVTNIVFSNKLCFAIEKNENPLSGTITENRNAQLNEEGYFIKLNSQISASKSFIKLNNGKIFFNKEFKTAIFDPITNKFYYNKSSKPENIGLYGVKLNNGEILYIEAITEMPSYKFAKEIYNLSDDVKYKNSLDIYWKNHSLEEQEKIYMPYLKNDSNLLKKYSEYVKKYDDSMYGWIYSPNKDNWKKTNGKISIRRRLIPYPTLLADGTILIIGGYLNVGICNDIEIYNPNTDSFEKKETTKKIRDNIYGVFPLKNGNVMFLYSDNYIFYNPITNTYSKEKDLILFGNYHIKKYLMLSDEKILMFVGYSTPIYSGSNIQKIVIFDPHTEEFTDGGTLAYPRGADAAWMFDCIELKDGRVLIMGGQENIKHFRNINSKLERSSRAEIYDPKTRTSKLINNMNYKRINSNSVLLDDGRVLIFGGSDIYNKKNTCTDFELYIPKNYKK